MNRFRTKKKGKDEDGAPRPSQDSESSMPFRSFRKGKKSQENEKKEIDLKTALPSNDDFRTSLLMTGLSARFSMLREQDDPNTKIGKASDDSVLFPKRQSRMDLASFRGLGDIAEVESLKAIPPFARMDSYNSDDADSLNAGSIMSRAKPTEGNNLFGGRQKIYKIPAGANSSKAVDGGMSGRALYDDDVAQSAFQKWRRAEKQRELSQEEQVDSDTQDEQRNSSDVDHTRPESPALSSYSRKRETSSTLSSTPSVARHSSAATSITSSQPTPSLKDWQPSSGYNSGPERSVTRTRRLYETGFFHQDSQESGPGGLSRMDTTSRQRPFGTRTPELGHQSPSLGFTNRLSSERKPLAKASAPNLRSISPPASASPTGPPNLGIRVPSTENKSGFGGAAPLSPPISETDENTLMSIDPNDLGKATALGVFQKPAQPYDESRFAQRHDKARSPSPVRQEMVDSPTAPVFSIPQSPKKDSQITSFLVDSDGSDTSSMRSPKPQPSPQIHVRKPSDREHPALRESTLPIPMLSSHSMKSQDGPSPNIEMSSALTTETKAVSPVDSPTLGPVPTESGLSGMVRQHLRADSNASSIYGLIPPTAGTETGFPADTTNSQDYGTSSNPWQDLDVNEPLVDTESVISDTSRPIQPQGESLSNEQNTDEFASRLADGARRIREKLTSYVETDSRSSSPHRLGDPNDTSDLAPLPRPSGLGAILRPRSSRGSLVDRGRDPTSSRAFKMMGISPGGSRTASPGSESQKGQSDAGALAQERDEREPAHTGDGQPAGLRQFRQARRELQRLKELESQSRHYPAPQGPPPDIPSPQQRSARNPSDPKTRTPGRDHQPPPVYYQQRVPSEELWNSDSHDSRVLSRSDRQRSESESSYEAHSTKRVTRSADRFTRQENMPLGFGGPPQPMMRATGLPGTDIKRSPIMPPQPHPNVSLRMNTNNQNPNGKLYVPRAYDHGQPSPVSPGASPLFNSAPQSPLPLSPRPQIAQNSSHDGAIGHMPYSHEAMNNRSHMGNRDAPPLPPINPRRRQDSTKSHTLEESFTRQDRDSLEQGARLMSPTRLNEPPNGVDRRAVFTNGNGNGHGANPNMIFNKPRNNSSPSNASLPSSRMTMNQSRNIPNNARLPGGMI
ncbi:hypothetical protein NPX13_g4551 [Xylaria arbuscula]|uniref:Uncharacterized protein n=1 Tax=Xylaria arbuscula TaxID=114810 RepID=A0A9W8NF99_9PEZI|nr:hypothetical protein NPX13_g4551 [Xylaria arbuscula]